jgi:hypothetical protein
MAITYPIAFPTTFGVSNFTIGLRHVVAGASSPFTLSEQIQVHQGTAWEISFSLELLNRDQAEAYNAFVLSLRGREGTFTMAVAGSETPRGAVSGTVLVKGAGQTGQDLIVDGLPLSTTGVFKAGDFIQIGTKLFKNLVDTNSNGAGEATLTLAPTIKTAFADNTAVVYTNSKGIFRANENMTTITITPPNQMSLSMSAREVV